MGKSSANILLNTVWYLIFACCNCPLWPWYFGLEMGKYDFLLTFSNKKISRSFHRLQSKIDSSPVTKFACYHVFRFKCSGSNFDCSSSQLHFERQDCVSQQLNRDNMGLWSLSLERKQLGCLEQGGLLWLMKYKQANEKQNK